MKKAILILLAVILCFSTVGCKQNIYPISSTQIMMDTVITISLYDGDSKILDGAIDLCRSYEQLLSKTVETSDVYKINHSGGKPVTVSADTIDLLNLALKIKEISDGAFDPNILPLVELWDVNNAKAPPDNSKITAALNNVSSAKITIKENTVVAENNAKIDLGGIAKGFIADKVKDYLKANGVKNAVINLGGNTQLLGDKKGEAFTIGVQKPFGKNGELSAVLELKDKTAVTSGIYQRFFEYKNVKYHHIIDPKTGYPCNNSIAAVTVIAESSAIADGLSTACLILGEEKGSALAKQYNAELIFIKTDGSLTVTDGLTVEATDKGSLIRLK